MEAAQQQRGAADGANNIKEIWYVSRTFGTPPVNKDGG
jgi:hypothetical protein